MTNCDTVKKSDVVSAILHSKNTQPKNEKGIAFAPTNIALCKYWGKRDTELNLPVTSSLSISLPDRGAMTTITLIDAPQDQIILNEKEIPSETPFAQRTAKYLDLFRAQQKWHACIDIKMSLPVAAGLASSACGFASLISALSDLFRWELSLHDLSILARIGSGSAARSFWPGFVEWHVGVRPDGMDSFAEPIDCEWSTLCVGILTISTEEKPISSREAMQRTVNSSLLYQNWPKKVMQDMMLFKQAMKTKNFPLLGGTAESNALAMHATMMSSWPPVCYYLPETITLMHKIWKLREQGLELYFTQDAGPNLKLLFLQTDEKKVREHFASVDVIPIFS